MMKPCKKEFYSGHCYMGTKKNGAKTKNKRMGKICQENLENGVPSKLGSRSSKIDAKNRQGPVASKSQ